MSLLRRPLVLIPVAVGVLLAAWGSLHLPYRGFRDRVLVDIPRGSGAVAISTRLAEAGVIRFRWQLLLARALRPRDRLHAGEYLFDRRASVWEIFDRMVRGDVFYHELTVPEGYNIFDIAEALDRLGVIGGDDFLRAARDPSLIRDLAPEAPTLEGYLFPDTYRVTRHMSAAQLCRQMTDRFRMAWAQLNTDAPVHETVTLASLIEKETALPEERPVVASVFRNRLRRGMRLECDPTAIYAALLEDRYRGALYRSDLERRHRYNTYQYDGLPPGPIANPGLASLEAALRPARTNYLYFVARSDDSGGHIFSATLDAHQRAVRKYRRGLASRVQAPPAGGIPGRKAARSDRRGRMGGDPLPPRSDL
ncbi:MAG: endolytic transglycosylase MltG [Bryobacterales bacterium]|nr:endolytic transglycosylase MltG [Bryobacteraceae bacterium]MDW8354348.1 endolytic transglycosylase MltG [Bryobacterales bacterium]